jgi:hypothetical protein
VILEHHSPRLGLGEARIAEKCPLAALDVDLDEVGLSDPRQDILRRDLDCILADPCHV